ncbi:hypothetical protein OESDEN_20480 [Oesophagostomum dentatum]|uniref:BOD1/SHG1 domain-containing protein n=1 Tax=Oesophagostomum dentatum TaxID=61180 RepID=A0A0B1S9F3_OESDE|nr:hypothetical protein OESDEN_20480 [Oesophagostomum dentatum]
MNSFRKVSDIKLDIEKSVKREGTFDVVRKQAFAIVNSDGFLDELQKRVAVDIRNMVRCNPERLSKEDLRSMIRFHLRTKYVPEISEKVNSSVDREWLKSQLADNVKEKVRQFPLATFTCVFFFPSFLMYSSFNFSLSNRFICYPCRVPFMLLQSETVLISS